MKNRILLFFCVVGFFVVAALSFKTSNPGQSEEPWRPDQLLSPGDLAKVINDPQAKQPAIICIGPGALIRGSIDIGPARDSGNLNKLRRQLSQLPKDTRVVIYCGCCPFGHCPNIRPAFSLLKEMKFVHPQLLNLEHNIKVDWMEKGYPVNK